jgi:CheY-like chemotaxis protein
LLCSPNDQDIEARRIAVVEALQLLDTDPEPAFDALSRVANQICGTPIAVLTLIDKERLFFKSRVGLEVKEVPREGTFCALNVAQASLFQIPDALRDPRFSAHPLVNGADGFRFYAGQPLSVGGSRIGAFCVIDKVPRQLSVAQQKALIDLALVAQTLLTQRLAQTAAPPSAPKPVAGQSQGPSTARRKKVVYVEDNRLNAMLLEQLFTSIADTDLIHCPSLNDLYRVLQMNVPDLLLLDINLPGASGLDILTWLKSNKATACLKVIMVSADATQEAINASRELGADDFWTKPLDLAKVLASLESLGHTRESTA